MAELNANLILAAGKAPEFPDPLQSYARVVGIQQMRQRMIDTQRDQQENDAIRKVLQGTNGDIEAALPQIRQISVPKSLEIERSYEAISKFKNDRANQEFGNRLKLADYLGGQLQRVQGLPIEQRQHAYDMVASENVASRKLLGLPPPTPEEWNPTYDQGTVDGYIASSQRISALLGKQTDAEVKPYTLNGVARMLRTTKDGRVWSNGQDVTEQVTPYEKPSAEGKQTMADKRVIAFAKAKGHLTKEGEGDPDQITNQEWEQLKREDKQAITIVNPKGAGAATYDQLTPADKKTVDAIMSNPEVLNRMPPTDQKRLIPALQEKGFTAWGKIDQQTRAMASMAREILPNIKRIREEAAAIDAAGLMGPVGSRWREFVTGTLHANELATDTETARLLGKFQTDIGLLRTATARAHGGARGGGSPQMLQHMKEIIGAQGDLPSFLGNMDALDSWMQDYAEMVPMQATPYHSGGPAGGGGGTAAPRVNPYRKK